MKHPCINGERPYAWDVCVELDVRDTRNRRVVTVVTSNRGVAVQKALETPLAIRVVDIEGMTESHYRTVYGSKGHTR